MGISTAKQYLKTAQKSKDTKRYMTSAIFSKQAVFYSMRKVGRALKLKGFTLDIDKVSFSDWAIQTNDLRFKELLPGLEQFSGLDIKKDLKRRVRKERIRAIEALQLLDTAKDVCEVCEDILKDLERGGN